MADVEKQLDTFLRKKPVLGSKVYIARGAVVVGDVTLGDESSIWYNAVLRGDINRIVIGSQSNVQDAAVIHLADDLGCMIGSHVTIGHSAIVHACTVEDGCLIGMGSVILDGAVVGAGSIVGAKSLVKQGMIIPPGSMVLGVPAKIIRPVSEEERAKLLLLARKYVENAAYCLKHKINCSEPFSS